jgi:hypothetical protein
MSHGLPDYYRGVDIAYQALGQIINRPKYGGAQYISANVQVSPGTYTTLISLSGKGMVYGGLVKLSYSLSLANNTVRLKADGNVISLLSFALMNNYSVNKPRSFPLTLNTFDDVKFNYSAGISYGITFETSFEIAYGEGYFETHYITAELVYALI